jgi:hypothetical protein
MSYAQEYYQQKVKPLKKIIVSHIFKETEDAENTLREEIQKHNDKFKQSAYFKSRSPKTPCITIERIAPTNRVVPENRVGEGEQVNSSG